MKITDLIKKEAIDLNVKASTKKEIIEKAVELMSKNQNITNKEDYLKLVLEREKKGTTGIGEEIAIPHGKGDSISSPGVAAMVIPEGTDFNSLDGKPVKLLFLIAAPNTEDNVHLEVLSRLSSLLMDENFRKELIKAKSKEEFLEIIDNAEKKAHNKEEKKSNYELLGITACPTGIAHTYMAAEALEKMGEELGHFIKVETQGQSGAQNILTEEEIKNAKAIIVAADVNVDLSRFNGKKVLKVGVSEGIHNPKKLIEKALKENSEIPIYHKNENSEKEENLGGNVYRHLMNGVTHMLPFVVGGGILIAIAFLLDDYSINPSNFGMNTPIAAFFKTIGGIAFDFMLIILSGYIAMSIGDRPGLAVGIVGGAIAKAGTTFSSLMNSEEVLISSGFLGALIAGFVGGYIIDQRDDTYVVFNEKGDIVLLPDELVPVSLGDLITVRDKESGLFGFADYNGNCIISPQYEDVSTHLNGYASFLQDGKWGHIDRMGNICCSPKYDNEYWFNGISFAVSLEQQPLLIDEDGHTLREFDCHSELSYFTNELILVTNDEGTSLINRLGTDIIGTERKLFIDSERGCNVYEQLIIVKDQQECWGYADLSGNVVCPCIWDSVSPFFNGWALVESEKKAFYIDHSMHIVFTFEECDTLLH